MGLYRSLSAGDGDTTSSCDLDALFLSKVTKANMKDFLSVAKGLTATAAMQKLVQDLNYAKLDA